MRSWLILAGACALAGRPAPAIGQDLARQLATADSVLADCIDAAETRTPDAAARAARADTVWRQLARTHPPAAAPRVGLARVLLECRLPLTRFEDVQGDLFSDAELQLTTALASDPTYWPARYVLANALARAPEYLDLAGAAIAQIDSLLAPGGVPPGSPPRAEALLLLGDLRRRTGDPAAAVAAWRAGAEEFPQDRRFTDRITQAGIRP